MLTRGVIIRDRFVFWKERGESREGIKEEEKRKHRKKEQSGEKKGRKKEGIVGIREGRKEGSVFVTSYVPGTMLSTFHLVLYLILEQPWKESPFPILQVRKQRPR